MITEGISIQEPVVKLPDMTKPYVLRIGVSRARAGVAAVLMQEHEGNCN